MYAGVDQIVIREELAASAACDLLEVSRSEFYAWRSLQESQRTERGRGLLPMIQEVFGHHRRRYEARRIAVELASRGIACGVARVARLMKTAGSRALQSQSYRPRTTQSRHPLGDNQNLIDGRAVPERINAAWVGDKQPRPPTDEGG